MGGVGILGDALDAARTGAANGGSSGLPNAGDGAEAGADDIIGGAPWSGTAAVLAASVRSDDKRLCKSGMDELCGGALLVGAV
jgi:hypothetical protein